MEGHKSVLLHECVDMLNLRPGMTVIDGTLGGGGHSEEILRRIMPGGRLIAIDKDREAIERVKKVLEPYREGVEYVHGDFKDIKPILNRLEVSLADGALLDLGVSSFQLDEADRGFSYNSDARLDMRMNREDSLSAYEVVNEYDEKRLARIIAEYGEERWAKRVAGFITDQRKRAPITTTLELCEVIKAAIPQGARVKGPHPAKRTFQAIRIEVNGELGGLDTAVEHFSDVLKQGGRLCVITFHSLEDRAVKGAMRRLEHPCQCPPDIPVCVCGKQPVVRVVTRKPVLPSQVEVEDNPRARSAKLRVCEKL